MTPDYTESEAQAAARHRSIHFATVVRQQLTAEPWPGAPDWRPVEVKGAAAIEVDPYWLYLALGRVTAGEVLRSQIAQLARAAGIVVDEPGRPTTPPAGEAVTGG